MSEYKVIILNGPPGSGKDWGAQYFTEMYGAWHKEFKETLFGIAKAMTRLSEEEWEDIYTRGLKEVPTEKCFGRSPRQLLIDISEKMCKPQFGKDYFGQAAAKSLQPGLNVFSDGGFSEELIPIIEKVGEENIVVARVKRQGCSFEGDSRNYLYDSMEGLQNILMLDIFNDGTDGFTEELEDVLIALQLRSEKEGE